MAATIDETSSMISKYMISKYIYVINLCSVRKSKNNPCARLHWVLFRFPHASRYSSCTTHVSMIVRQRYILKGFVTGGPENRKTWTPVVWWCSSFVQTWADYYYLGHRSILVFTGAQHQILVFAPTSGLCDGFHNRPHGLSASIAAPPQRRSGRGEERNGLGIFSLSCFPMS